MSDILGTEEDVIYQGLEQEAEHRVLGSAISKLSEREQVIVKLRFGINMPEGRRKRRKKSRIFLEFHSRIFRGWKNGL